MAKALHPITIKISESAYQVANEQAQSRGYFSVEDYVSDWLESDAITELPMTPEIALALEEGLADSRANRVVSLEEYILQHAEMRAAWIKANQA